MLMILKNGLLATFLGTLAALIMGILFYFQILPDCAKLQLFDSEAQLTSIWALLTGMFVSVTTLLCWRPRQTMFVDHICIDQASPESKAEGVLNMGAFLRMSRSMLVLWDSTYAERLWCASPVQNAKRSVAAMKCWTFPLHHFACITYTHFVPRSRPFGDGFMNILRIN